MDRSAALTGAVVVAAALGCAYLLVRTTQPVVHDSADGGDPLTVADPPSRPLGANAETLAPARCVDLAPTVPLDGVAPGALDWGDGVFDARGLVAAGVVRSKPGERAASVVTFAIGEGSGKPVVIDLGRASGDDPAPRPFVLGATLYAARVESGRDKRRLVVSELGAIDASGALAPGAGGPKEAASFPQGNDESLAYDLAPSGAHAFVVWDDDELGRGVIRAARFGDADAGAAPVVISPKSADAEAPRLVDDGAGGAWVAWIARKAELDAGAADLAAHAVETPAEAREERWVEVAHLDASGTVVGTPVRLAPARVSDFDLHREGATPSVVVVMRDEEGTLEARGARLVRQIVRAEGQTLQAGGVAVLVGEGVGSADPIVVDDGAAGLVAYADLAERPRLSPLAPSTGGAPDVRDAGAPSLELGLEGGRVLASRPLASVARSAALAAKIKRPSDRGAAVFAAGAKQDRAEARILLCER